MSKIDIIEEFLTKLKTEDPPHALMLLGIKESARWIKNINDQERVVLFEYIAKELSKTGDLPIKEQLIKVLQEVGGSDSLKLLDKFIVEGEIIHGKFLISDAIHAKKQIQRS